MTSKKSDYTVPPKSKTGQGLNFVINQEKYLRIFLEDGDVPIDNSASERAIRTFCLGKRNWMFHNTAKGTADKKLPQPVVDGGFLVHCQYLSLYGAVYDGGQGGALWQIRRAHV